jgi:ribosomal protein S18 acetylase RimI-like enzyme
MNYHIRLFKQKDKDIFLSILVQYLEEYTAQEHVYPISVNKKIVNEYWKLINKKSQRYVLLLTFVDDQCVGFMLGSIHMYELWESLYYEGDRRGEAWDLYIKPEWRGKKLGQLLMSQLEEEFKKRGCEHVILNDVRMDNMTARKLYEQLGYIPWNMKYYKRIQPQE